VYSCVAMQTAHTNHHHHHLTSGGHTLCSL
jgi:hypothetical protein